MKTFTYPFIAKLVYRYANIPVSLLLVFHLMFLLVGASYELKLLLPASINIIILYIMNRYYIKMYKLFPYKIEIEKERMICSDFFMSKKKLNIQLTDIINIDGGIFTGNPTKPIYLTDIDGNTIGVNQHLKNYNIFLTTILSSVKKEVYETSLNKINKLKDKQLNSLIMRLLNKSKKSKN